MNDEDIVRMAREAGAQGHHNPDCWDVFLMQPENLERFAAIVAAAERNAILETVNELMGAEQGRNAMFSDGYDYALGHVKEFIEGRAP
jgi:hypothetical protein